MARCNLTLVVLFALVLVVLCCLSSFSEAKSIAAGRFALNGKTTADAGSNQLDWDVVYFKQENETFSSVFVKDYFTEKSGSPQRDPSSWFQGLSKDSYDIPSWRWTPNLNTNDKGNILNAYATVVSDNSTGEVSLFFGLDREAQNGAATVGYWFLQDPNFGLGSAINKNAYTFNGKHKDGDLLIVADYPGQGSGTPASIELLIWSGGNVRPSGTYGQIFYTDTKAACNPNDATQTVCAVTNDYENITSPWYYDGKFAQGYTIPARNFFEGGILLNGLVDLAGLSYLPCYSSFLATTRVSNQVNSVSMDFAYGALHKCGLALDANCLGGRQLVLDLNTTKYTIPPFEWNYTVSVTNQGYNDLFDVVVELNGYVIYNIGTLKSQEIFFENGTVPTNASKINMVFKARATGNLGRTVVVDSSNPCTSPVPVSDNGLTPGEAAAIAIGGFVGAAIGVAAFAGLVAAGYLAMRHMNAAPPPEELTSELTDQGNDAAGINNLFEDNVTEGVNPMFNSPAV